MATLSAIYSLLLRHFGPLTGPAAARPWWPIYGDDPPFEMLVGAVLVQQTRWETVEAAVLRLIGAGLLAPAALAEADAQALAALIRPAAFHTQKAPGLIRLAGHIVAHYSGSTTLMLSRPAAALRAELLALPRIGPETCDVTMLYGGGHPVFVVDEYTRRLFERVAPRRPEAGARGRGGAGARPRDQEYARPPDHQIAGTPGRDAVRAGSLWRQPYEVVRGAIEEELSGLHPAPFTLHPLYAEFHAQINEACVRYCLVRPRCDGPPARRVYSRQNDRESYLDRDEGCPLRPICGYYQQRGDKEIGER